jgi:hypothetical protein
MDRTRQALQNKTKTKSVGRFLEKNIAWPLFFNYYSSVE